MGKLVVVLLVLAGLAVGADRVGAVLAANEAEQRLVAEGFVDPSVTVHGFPFLTQLADRRFDRVSVDADRLQVAEGEARAVSGELLDVGGGPTGPVDVATLSAEGTVPYEVVRAAVDLPSLQIRAGSSGQVEVAQAVEIAGETVDVVAQARVRARGDRIRVVPTGLGTADGSLPPGLTRQVADLMTFEYRLPELPEGLALEEVRAGADGFAVRVTGTDVSLRR